MISRETLIKLGSVGKCHTAITRQSFCLHVHKTNLITNTITSGESREQPVNLNYLNERISSGGKGLSSIFS